MTTTYQIDAWDAAETVAAAINETKDAHGCTARAGDRAPVVLVSRMLSRGRQDVGRFTFRELDDETLEIAQVPTRMRAALIAVAESALEEA